MSDVKRTYPHIPHRSPPPNEKRDDTCGFFVFDYNRMDSYYGQQAFETIFAVLRSSSGVCAFHDGDVLNIETVREIATRSNLVMPSSSESPLASLNGPFEFGPYFAAMWTDVYGNFERLHNGLIAKSISGYLGYMTLPGKIEGQDVVQLFTHQLSLPASIALKDGSIIKGTSKYGIGFRSADDTLLRAAALGDVEAARKAIDDGADVDCVDPNDRVATSILHASSNGCIEIVKMLLEMGANPNARNMGSNTALMLAARFGHIKVVAALIAAGADVNATDRSGETALDNAEGHPEIQRVLRSAGSDEKRRQNDLYARIRVIFQGNERVVSAWIDRAASQLPEGSTIERYEWILDTYLKDNR